MLKALLIDLDGIIILRNNYFSERLSSDYGIPMEKIMPFFNNEYQLCVLGKADLRNEIEKYFAVWRWEKSLDELLEYWFGQEKKLSEDILKITEKFRHNGIKCYLISDNEKYRAEYLEKNTKLSQYFDDLFFSYQFGNTKSQPEFFHKIISKIGFKSQEIIYLDDDEKNVAVAKSIGIKAIKYEKFEFSKEKWMELQK